MIAVVKIAGGHLGVGLGEERIALFGQQAAQLEIVLYDAVMDQHDPFGPMRMGVFVGRASMSCPAGMAHAAAAFQWTPFDGGPQIGKASRAFDGMEGPVVAD